MLLRPRRIIFTGAVLGFAVLAAAGILVVHEFRNFKDLDFNQPEPKYYSAEDFGIETVHSSVDFNKNGIDDYMDILLGARKDAENMPQYDGSYFASGYPPDDKGVCTDLVWRAFKNAGYSLKDMLDRDIKNHTKLYPRVYGRPEPNIDFRRVPNLKVYFSRFAVSMTLDTKKFKEWQPGDIVVYGTSHIGIVSDRRNKDGVPYLIHNAGQKNREQDALNRDTISGHYRFDASRLKTSDLIRFK